MRIRNPSASIMGSFLLSVVVVATAVQADAPILRYLVKTDYPDRLRVLPSTFDRQNYAFALRPGSKLRERLNRAILEHVAEPDWQDTLYRYLGEQP